MMNQHPLWIRKMVGEVLEVMRGLADEGMTIAGVTHEMAFARDVSNYVVFMSEGVICEEGKPGEVFTNPRQQRTREFLSRFSRADYRKDRRKTLLWRKLCADKAVKSKEGWNCRAIGSFNQGQM